LPLERAKKLDETLNLLVQIGYLRMEEVPGIPRLAQAPGAVIFAPLGDSPVDPDAVLFAAPVSKVMLLEEAAQRAGCAAQIPVSGRPTCMALPAAMAHGTMVSSGCSRQPRVQRSRRGRNVRGHPRKGSGAVAREIETALDANTLLAQYHQSRREAREVVILLVNRIARNLIREESFN
jgi:hypothetical protein